MNTAVERAGDSGPAKRCQILVGARRAFADLGYERTTMDQIAASAGVSKATVYNHFQDKKAVFVACFSEEADEMRAGLRASLGEPAGDAHDIERALLETGEKLMNVALAPPVICLYRHTIAEVGRFPEIGETLFERGPKQIHDMIAAYLKRWEEKGALRLDDPGVAAVQFFLLCQGDLKARALLGVLERPAEASIRATVKRGVRTFLRAYGA